MSTESPPSHIDFPIIRLTAADRNRLKAQARRSGLTPLKLFARLEEQSLPQGLTAVLVKAWIGGKEREAPASWFMAVITVWETMPDHETRIVEPHRCKAITVRKGRARIALTGEMRKHLLSEIARTDTDYASLLANAPQSLNERLIRSWEAGNRRRSMRNFGRS